MTAPFNLSRRALLAGGLACAVTPALGRLAAAGDMECRRGPSLTPMKPRAERAVSLRQVSALMSAGKPAKFDGLTRLDGYIIDKDNNDIILWGLAEKNQPELQVDDFVVALRAAHQKYTEVRDGTTYLVNPLISIDPDPAALRRLDEVDVFAPGGRKRRAELCSYPQAVRVEGMPRNTRLARVLVDADYRMKQVGQGHIKLPIATPFPASFDARVAAWREADEDGVKSDKNSNTRYWFQPGKFSYQASDDAATVFLDVAQVVLNDEDQMLKPGELVASGKIDVSARNFTCAWTDRMEDIYRAEPIWRDMHNIFRHFALTRIMKDRDAFGEAGFAGGALLDRYEIPRVEVPATIPGLLRTVDYETRRGRTTTKHASSACGGVSVGFNKPLDKNPDAAETRASGRSVIAARPAPTTVAWAVTPGSLNGVFGGSKGAPAAPVSPAPSAAPAPSAPKKSLGDLFRT